MARVLVIDDDQDIGWLVRRMVEARGHDVVVREDGLRGLAAAQRQRPDVIVLDLMMPVMDGWEFRREQLRRAALARIPVIVVSAAGRERLRQIDANAYLSKPVDLEELRARIEEYCPPA